MKVGDAVRFREDVECHYEAHIIEVDRFTHPPLLTVEVKYDTCVVITVTTEDDLDIIPNRLPASTSAED